MAELVDALDLGSSGVTPVGVRVPPFAHAWAASVRSGSPRLLFYGQSPNLWTYHLPLPVMLPRICSLSFLLLVFSSQLSSQHRYPDSLLFRPDLQHLVDLQIEREGKAIIPYLEHSDPLVRARAAFALASVQDPNATPALLAHLNDTDPRVRADVAFALGQTADSTVTSSLLTLLRNEADSTVRRELLIAIGKTGTAAHLQALLTSPLPASLEAERALSVGRFALRDVHHPMAMRYLVAHLEASDPELRRNAAYYFGRSRKTAPWEFVQDSVRQALHHYSPAEPAAMHLLLALGRLQQPEDDSLIIHWLQKATDWRTRVHAARALRGRTARMAVRKALLEALSDSSEHVALTAARLLTEAPHLSPEEVQVLFAWVERPNASWRVQGALLPVLVRAGYLSTVYTWMDRQRNRPRAVARGLRALALTTDTSAVHRLITALRNPHPLIASAALDALARHWYREQDPARYFPLFREALERGDLALSFMAASLLGDSLFVPLGSTRVLIKAYRSMHLPEDIEPMTAILQALGNAGDPAAVPFLQEVYHEAPHPVLQEAAAEALHRLTGRQFPVTPRILPPDRTINWASLQRVGPFPEWILETEKGTIVIRMDTEQAPLTVQTLLQLTEEEKFDNVPFHRVVPNFVIQGGDFERGDGFGGPGFAIRSEFTRIPYTRGTAGMASAGKDTEGSQYFITHSMQPHLDGRYTAFGRVVTGQDVVDRIYEGDRVLRAHWRPGR